MFLKLQKKLKKLDIFGYQVSFTFQKEQLYKTSFGGFISLVLFIFIFGFFFSNIANFITRNQVYSESRYNFDSNPSLLRLNPSNFMFAVQIEQSNFTMNPFFNITVEQRHYQRFENGSQIKLPSKYIDLVPCTELHFNPIFEKYDINFTEEFRRQNLNNFLCPNLNNANSTSFEIGGQWSSTKIFLYSLDEEYKFIKFAVTQCRENESDFTWKPQCKSKEEIQETLEYYGDFRFQLYTTNYLTNPNNANSYIQPYLAIDQFYTFIPDSMFVQSDIFVKGKTIKTDYGLTMFPNVNLEEVGFRDIGDMRSQFEINKLTPGYYAAFYLNRSPYSYVIERSFLKFDKLLSYLGGLIQCIIIIMSIIVKFYNEQNYLIDLANELYEFEKDNRNLTDSSVLNYLNLQDRLRRAKTTNNQLKTQTLQIPSLNNFQSNSHIRFKTCTNAIKMPKQPIQRQVSAYERFSTKTKQIKFSLKILLNLIFNIKYFMNDEAILMQKAQESVFQELDIVFLIRKMHDIKKLTQVIFTKEQETLFNVSHKPRITLLQKKRRRKAMLCSYYQKDSPYFDLVKNFQDLVSAYKSIILQSISTPISEEQMRFNERLTYLLGVELINILEKEIESIESIQEYPTPESENIEIHLKT